MSDIARKGVSAAKWSTITTLARFVLQLLAQIVLARVLGPDVYGVFGMGLVVFTFSNFLATFGISWSLAQLKTIDDKDIRFAFTWQLVIGVTAGAMMYAASPMVAEYFKEPRVGTIVKWMALACVINAAGSVTGNLMRRDMNFRASGLIQFGSYLAGYIVVGIPLALWGAGVDALVAAWVVQALVVWVAGYCVRPHPMKPLLVGPQAREMLRTGAAVFFTNLANWLINNLDRMLIGRFLNAHAMGVYTVGYNLANMPNTLLLGALQPVFLAAGARVQDQREKLATAYRQVCATIWVILLPMFIVLAAMAPDLVRLLYGPAWTDASSVLAVLFLAMPAFVTWGMSTPVLWNTQRARYEVLLQLPLLPLAVGGFYFFGRDSVLTAAIVAALVLAARGLVVAVAASRILQVGPAAWVGWIARGALTGAVLAGLLWALSNAMPAALPALLRLAAMLCVSLVFGSLLLLLIPRVLGQDAAQMVVRFVPPLRRRLVPSDTGYVNRRPR